ncbi:hypothetical protein GH714_014207 [Hevea brasiliensis]|uniref:NAC domain-containing protein n=1 Tax=Hevea brasiliensis TaxID=3981 RepID=A0A6A6KQM1_HEVBR|nr:hypothetical protein GH714_014207 [Hevea brasiliensis]
MGHIGALEINANRDWVGNRRPRVGTARGDLIYRPITAHRQYVCDENSKRRIYDPHDYPRHWQQAYMEELDLPGFRFHPTEEELLDFYLKNMVFGKKLRFDIIGYLNIYHHDPWELPGMAKNGEREWYFFVPRDRRHGSGGRPNRTTVNGFWKATGSDRKIVSLSDPKRIIGLRKTLVFYKGRAPRGSKTDWVMNEYRLPDSCPLPKDIVLCKIYRKATSLKVLEQRAAMEEEMKIIHASPSSSPISSLDNMSFCSQQEESVAPICMHHVVFKKEVEDLVMAKDGKSDDK